MNRVGAVLIALFLTAAAYPQSVQYQPIAPTTRDAVTMWVFASWSYGCAPDPFTADVSGHDITIHLGITQGACRGGFPVLYGWTGKLTIGPLPAGVYSVTTAVDNGITPPGGARQPDLVVRDASSPLTVITADATPTMTRIAMHSDIPYNCPLSQNPCPAAIARAGDVTSTDVTFSTPNDLIATFPPLTPGTYDVTVPILGSNATATAALTVVDPAVAPFPQTRSLERVLIPVVFSGPGAFGSQWTTQVAVTNAGPVPLDFYRSPFGSAGPLQPRQTRTITTDVVGQQPNGIYVYVPRAEERDMQFNALVRDLSHQSTDLGTEFPVVRESEFFHQRFNLMNVPADPKYRAALRLYTLGGVTVVIQIYKMGETVPLVDDRQPVSLFGPTEAASLVISDLVAKYPQLAGAGSLRVELQRTSEGNFGPSDPGLWGFISVTNNDTQHVTVISPQ